MTQVGVGDLRWIFGIKYTQIVDACPVRFIRVEGLENGCVSQISQFSGFV